MKLLSANLLQQLEHINIPIINLHPALPGKYPGVNAIQRAYDDFTQGLTNHSGVMIHFVVPEMDAGEVIEQMSVPLLAGDSLAEFETRIHAAEKIVLINAVEKMVYYKRGKVRNMIDLGHNQLLAIHTTDRLSAFDRAITNIPEGRYFV